MSKVKDMSLAPEGVRKIEWVQKHMPVLEHIKAEYLETQPFKGITIGSCLHLEPKTINLGLTLMAGGAEVAMTGCNPLSTHDDAVAGAADLGLNVYGWREQDDEEYYQTINMVLDHKPDIIIDDGADMIMVLHNERTELLKHIKGACEETTTGVHRLQAMHADGALKFPVIAVNDAYTKYLFDNRYGTGQSSFDAIMGTTNMVIAGKTVVVCGYGWCGRGLALRAAGLGADVIVTEVDPIRALEARMDGYRVMTIREAVKQADLIITVTGNADIICGDLQSLGVHMYCGGGQSGFIAMKDEEKFVGECPLAFYTLVETVDGQFGYAEMLPERTSYEARDKGKDWVGTASGLWTIAAAAYMSLMGPQGMQEIGETLVQNASFAKKLIDEIPGVETKFDSTFKEFVVNFDKTGKTVAEINEALRARKIYGGIDLSQQYPELGQSALYCFTEVITVEDIKTLVDALKEVC